MSHIEKAKLLHALHVKGDPIILYNIWDAGSAKTVAANGAKAIATGSWSMAAAHGYPDGQALPLNFALQVIERITQSVDLPVSVDFEGGYAIEPEAVTRNVERLIAAGAVGLNFEDQVVGSGELYPVAAQAARLTAVQAAAAKAGVPIFLNARTDLFLKAPPGLNPAELIGETIARASAYSDAGANGFFVPGLTDLAVIRQIAAQISLPLNVMMMGALSSPKDAAQAGASRISFGPGPYQLAQEDLTRRFTDI